MNNISDKRVGVDGEERSLAIIEKTLVDSIEGDIRIRLNLNKEVLKKKDQLLMQEIIDNLHDLLTANAARLKQYADYFDNTYKNRFCYKPKGHEKSTQLGEKILASFNYSAYRETVLVEVAKQLNVKTCPYCNMHYTLYANERETVKGKGIKGITRFQFDHFFDKLHYPMLSMSFYNLIPSCPLCNQSKHNKTLSLTYHPYNSDIHKQFHFELSDPLGPYTAARLNDEVDVSLIPEDGVNKDDFKEYEKTYHLKSLYGRHGDIIQEVFDKAYENPYYQNPANFDFLSDRDSIYLKRIWFGNYMESKEIEKRPLSKFMQDMEKQARGDY